MSWTKSSAKQPSNLFYFESLLSKFDTYLSDHTLGDFPWVEGVVETETSDMGVGANTLNPSHVLDILHLGVNT